MRNMMRMGFLTAALLAGGGLLAGCDNTAKDSSAAAAVSAAADTVKVKATQLQTITASVCGYVPTASTAANLVGTMTGFGALTATLTGLAQEFCDAVTKPGAKPGGPVVRGVTLHYTRAKK